LASKDKEVKETPLMKQYNEIKRKYPDACLLFRVGDFTKHSEKMLSGLQKYWDNTDQAWCGFCNRDRIGWFPHHSINTYLPKLVKAGLRVAICDQLEDPKMTKIL
jgi:DNA mismatch repair protein MutS